MRRALAVTAAVLVVLGVAGCNTDSQDTRRMKACIAAGGTYDSGTWGHWTCTLPGGRRG